MRWLWFIVSLGCFAVAFRTHSMGLAVLCLVAALVFVLMGTLAVASSRIESRGRDETAMLGPEEMRHMREQIERRKRESDGAGVAVVGASGGGASKQRHNDNAPDYDSVGDAGGGGGGD